MRQLIMFTNSFPFGKGENWIYEELQVLHKFFAITIMPLTYEGNCEQRWALPDGVSLHTPLFEKAGNYASLNLSDIFLVFRRGIFTRIAEIFRYKVLFKRSAIHQYLNHIRAEEELISHPFFRRLLADASLDATAFYFYWGLGAAQVIPALPPSSRKIFVRMHGYDLYDHRNNGYIPFRSVLMRKATLVLPVSRNGQEYLISKFPAAKDKVAISRLGTMSAGVARKDRPDGLSIFSCSALIPLKRVHLIVSALSMITDIDVKWTHLGDGPERNMIEQLIAGLPANITAVLKGHLAAREIPAQYVDNEAGLFLHVSETEGVPVAVMEALAASIPVLATNVGGTAEIIDESVGGLLSPEITAEQLAEKIRDFHRLSDQKKQAMRQAALDRYNAMCNAHVNAYALVKLMTSAWAD